MNIRIVTIPHKEQRYNTCGDYLEMNDGSTLFLISKLKDKRYEYLVLIHELVEYFLVKRAQISLKKIDDFDIKFEKTRKSGNTDEPGDCPAAPYYVQHQAAILVERLFAFILGVNWNHYDKTVLELYQ